MHIMNWDDVRFFLVTARSGSLTAASLRLDTHQPTVGRRIDALEASLGVTLFLRHPQGLTLTEEGNRILLAAEAMEEAAISLKRNSSIDDAEVRGCVHIAAPQGLGTHLIAPNLQHLHERYPHLNVILQPATASADLIHGEAEVAVRLYKPISGDLVTRYAGEMEFGLYGAQSYLQRHGIPSLNATIQHHFFIAYGKQLSHLEENHWLESLAKDARIIMRSDDTHARFVAANSGLGLAVLPHFLARQSEQLQPVQLTKQIPSKPVWLVVHRDLRYLARVRAVFDWLTEQLIAAGFKEKIK